MSISIPRSVLDRVSHRAPISRPSRSLRALIRLRWIAVAGQAATIALVVLVWRADLPLAELFAVLGGTAASNLLLARLARGRVEAVIGGVVVLDIVLLTVLLGLTGGPANPFSLLYLVHVMLAAIITSPKWTWLAVAASSAGFGALFFASVPLPAELGGQLHVMAGHQPYSAHLQGMWVAYTLAAATIAAFVSRLATALRTEREDRTRAAHLLGLATLAAGAAHEIGNPLATIRVAAGELEEELATRGLPEHVISDLRLINAEVGRAHDVLGRMAAGAGELAGEPPVAASLDLLMAETVRQLGADGARIAIETEDDGGELGTVSWPVHATSQALAQLLRNAVQASPPDAPVACRLRARDGGIAIDIRDRGEGMSPEVIERLGQPFFTTRPAGMGLGVFIARSFIESFGGTLSFRSGIGRGTVAHAWLPRGAHRD